MHPSSNLGQGTVAYRVPRVALSLMLLALGCWGIVTLALVAPGIIRRFVPPCAGCYLGAFVPPVEPYRNPVKQSGSGGTAPPALNTERVSVVDMPASQPGGYGYWLAPSNLIAAEQTSLSDANGNGQRAIKPRAQDDGGMKGEFYAIAGSRGYTRALSRFAPGHIGFEGRNDDPMARAMWTGVPIGSLAGDRLNVPSMPETANLVDGVLASASIGPNAPRYGSQRTSDNPGWDAAGVAREVGTSGVRRSVPYWRVAVQKNLQQHFMQIGTYGMNGSQLPAGGQSAAAAEGFADLGADANYRFIVDPGSTASNIISAHSILVHQNRSLDAGTRANSIFTLDTFRADLSWGIADTVIPSIQYFRAAGPFEAMQYLWPGARPNSAGVVAGVTYLPWNSAGSPVQFLNLRLAAQYVSYTEFYGNAHGAGGINGVYFSLWGALRF